MKETNLPETQLRSWQPRRPSAKLRERIFQSPAPDHRFAAWSLRWLAPAAACMFLALTVLHQGSSMRGGSSEGETIVGMILSNRLAYFPDSHYRGQNDFSAVTLGWTNRGGSTSSINSFSPDRVN